MIAASLLLALTAATGEVPDRTLHGHVFLFPTLQSSALVTTHFAMREGVARLEVPDFPLGRLGNRDLVSTGLRQSLEFGLGVTNWLGVWVRADGTITTGTRPITLLEDGADFLWTGEVGGAVRLFRFESTGTQLTARIAAARGKGNELSLVSLLENI